MKNLKTNKDENRFSFVQQEILNKKVQDDKVTNWNNIVKECKVFEFGGKTFMLVQDVKQSQFYVVDKDELSE